MVGRVEFMQYSSRKFAWQTFVRVCTKTANFESMMRDGCMLDDLVLLQVFKYIRESFQLKSFQDPP